MSEPQSWEEACEMIDARLIASLDEGVDAYAASMEQNFNEFRVKYPRLMEGKTLFSVKAHNALKDLADDMNAQSAPLCTATQLWDAVSRLDALALRNNDPLSLRKLLCSENFGPIPLGKVYGTHQLWLLPAFAALPSSVTEVKPKLKYSQTFSEAISYPDGHPSEDEFTLRVNNNDDEEELRRYVSLGWVVQGTRDEFEYTGHALVIDVEEGRNLNPWIVLSSKYPNNGEPTWTGDYKVYVPEIVDRDDPETDEGVLPGDNNRTPVGKIKAIGAKSTTPIIRLFGPDFQFTIIRRGSARGYIRSNHGPGLARIMEWRLDPDKNQEVCYLKDGREYMRFDLGTRRIMYSKRATESFAGEQGLFGEITKERGFLSLQQRFAQATLGGGREPLQTRSREISSSSGF